MKYIVAIIQPHKLDEVMKTLEDVEVNLVTVSNVLGRGRQKGLTEVYRGAKEVGSLYKVLAEASKSTLVRETLGDHIFEKFLENKQAECDTFRIHVSQFEIGRYPPIL